MLTWKDHYGEDVIEVSSFLKTFYFLFENDIIMIKKVDLIKNILITLFL